MKFYLTSKDFIYVKINLVVFFLFLSNFVLNFSMMYCCYLMIYHEKFLVSELGYKVLSTRVLMELSFIQLFNFTYIATAFNFFIFCFNMTHQNITKTKTNTQSKCLGGHPTLCQGLKLNSKILACKYNETSQQRTSQIAGMP